MDGSGTEFLTDIIHGAFDFFTTFHAHIFRSEQGQLFRLVFIAEIDAGNGKHSDRFLQVP